MKRRIHFSVFIVFFFLQRGETNEAHLSEGEGTTNQCKCAPSALRQMQLALHNYTSHVAGGSPSELDDVIEEITEIAYNCTNQRQCRCPDGYFKTRDGHHCLKVSREEVDCDKATEACSRDPDSRLAVAKDQVRLTELADEIRHIEDDNSEDFYWIGLSYNSTDKGFPLWTWEDGSTASYNITSSLKLPVKKSLIRIDVKGKKQAIERVAISKNYQGQHWKQEMCGSSGRKGNAKRHKYICE